MKLFKRRKKSKYIVWGIRVSPKTKDRWIALADFMRVPCNRLILFAIREWMHSNQELLLDNAGREELLERITHAYLRGELDT